MIQRKQSLYLLACIVLSVSCLFMPVGNLFAGALPKAEMGNFSILFADGQVTHQSWALGALLVCCAVLQFMAIFLFRRRALQMRFCTFCIILQLGWYATLAGFAYVLGGAEGCSFRPTLFSAIPAVEIILLYLAFRGIMKDEMLVRSLDRIR